MFVSHKSVIEKYPFLTVLDFPLWHMGISGYEALVMSTVSPFLLGMTTFRSLVIKNIRLVHLLSLTGLLGFLVTSPVLRLFSVGFGVSTSCLAWSATWYAERGQPARLQNRILGWSIGLIASSTAKFAFQTNNPIWPILHFENGGWNKIGLSIAIFSVIRSTKQSDINGSGLDKIASPGSPILAGLGFGGLLFGMHSLLSDSSTMIFWVWEGFPVRGPIAANGVLTIFAMGSGLFADSFLRNPIPVRIRLIMCATGALTVTYFSHWFGYLGGLFLAFSLMSLSTTIIGSASRGNPAKAFGFGFLVYNIMVLAHVWVVAYAFVPGGPVMREHTDWIMAATVILIGAGVLAAPEIQRNGKSRTRTPYSAPQKANSYHVTVLAFVELLAIAVSYLRFPTNDYVPYHKDDKIFTAGIWTIHFALDNDMWSSEYRIRDVVKELEIDVLGLLETDNQRIIMGNRDPTQVLAEELGMYVDYGPGPNKHTWGCALLSKFPILNSTHHLLPSPVGELAPAIHATLDAYGELVDVVVFHSGQEEDPEDRRLQSEYLAKLMHDSPRPLVLLSYLVTKPLEGNYNTYVGEKSGMKDIDPSDDDRWCEYILYKGLKRTGYARVSRSTITDTEIQVSSFSIPIFSLLTEYRQLGKFAVGQPEIGVERVNEDEVVPGLRFPSLFRGEGVRGHRYHVFDEPRYFS